MKVPISKDTKVRKLKGKKLRVTHTQSIRASLHYQSAEVSYGISFVCTEEEFKQTLEEAEAAIEAPLVKKHKQQVGLLLELGRQHANAT